MKKLTLIWLTFLTVTACATSAPRTNTIVLLTPDLAGPPPEGVARKGDVFVTAVQTASGGATLSQNVRFMTALGGGSAKSGDQLFVSQIEDGQKIYCTMKKSVNAVLTYNERFSACFRDSNNDGAFDRVSMLDFRNRLSFGSGRLRHETEIAPTRYWEGNATSKAPTQRLGLRYMGSGHYLRNIHEGRQFRFRRVAEVNGKWKNISDTYGFNIRPDETKTIRAFGGVYELTRTGNDHIQYREMTPITPRRQRNRTVTIVRSRY